MHGVIVGLDAERRAWSRSPACPVLVHNGCLQENGVQTQHVERQDEAGAEVFIVGFHCLGELHACLLRALGLHTKNNTLGLHKRTALWAVT